MTNKYLKADEAAYVLRGVRLPYTSEEVDKFVETCERIVLNAKSQITPFPCLSRDLQLDILKSSLLKVAESDNAGIPLAPYLYVTSTIVNMIVELLPAHHREYEDCSECRGGGWND